MTPDRRAGVRVTLLAAPLACVLAATSATPAQAAGYRYWSFWERPGGGWAFARTAPARTRPADGSVEGWRFAVSTEATGTAPPRGSADFGTICAATAPRAGTKRLAIVLDFGTQDDAPDGDSPPDEHTACAQVPLDASATDALAAVAKPVRYGPAGLLCAIAGYPHAGCGDRLPAGDGQLTASPSASAAPGTAGSTGPSLVLPALAAVVALGAAAVAARHRARRGT